MFNMQEIWSFDSQKNYKNCCHQMSDFKAKMHQIRFRPGGSAPDPAGGAYSAPPDPLAGFKGAYFEGKGGGREGEGEGG